MARSETKRIVIRVDFINKYNVAADDRADCRYIAVALFWNLYFLTQISDWNRSLSLVNVGAFFIARDSLLTEVARQNRTVSHPLLICTYWQ
jgi:uncharacterized membrane protein